MVPPSTASGRIQRAPHRQTTSVEYVGINLECTEFTERLIQDLVIQEDQCVEGLVLRAGRHIAFQGEVLQECRNLRRIQLRWSFPVEVQNEAANPTEVRFVRANRCRRLRLAAIRHALSVIAPSEMSSAASASRSDNGCICPRCRCPMLRVIRLIPALRTIERGLLAPSPGARRR